MKLVRMAVVTTALMLVGTATAKEDCIAREITPGGTSQADHSNPRHCYDANGDWQWRWELRGADGAVETGPLVAGKKHGRWEYRLPDGAVEYVNYVNGELQE